MRSLLLALSAAGLAWKWPAYARGLEHLFHTHDLWTLLAAGLVAFFPPWFMGRAFMTRQEAEREAAIANARPDYYDFDTHRRYRNPQLADAEGIKVQYLLMSLCAWGLQAYLLYTSIRFFR